MDKDFPRKRVVLPGNLPITYIDVEHRGEIPVLWIHGMGSYREAFHALFTDPPVPGRHIAMDLPGFGNSGHLIRRHTLGDYAHAVVSFLDALELSEVVLVGHSFGGMVAGETVSRYPDRVSGVVLISSAGWFNPENALEPTRWFWLNRMGIWLTGMEYFGRRMIKALGVNPDRLFRADRRRFQWGWRHAYEMARMGTFYESPQFLPRILQAKKPITVIHGTQDLLFPWNRVRQEILHQLPFWPIGGAGHVPFYSHPDAFRAAFRSAFDEVLAGPHNDSQ